MRRKRLLAVVTFLAFMSLSCSRARNHWEIVEQSDSYFAEQYRLASGYVCGDVEGISYGVRGWDYYVAPIIAIEFETRDLRAAEDYVESSTACQI